MDVFNDALTLLHQYRYVEAYELVEKADADPETKHHYLVEIARKQKQHLLKSLPQPFTEVPANLAERPVQFWLWFPYLLPTVGLMLGMISINSGNISMLFCGSATFLTLFGWFIGDAIAKNQIKRYEQRNMERLLKSVHAMLRVYQHLIEQDYRAAREVLESGDVMPNVARAWLMWLNNVHITERKKAGLKVEQSYLSKPTEINLFHYWLAMLLYFIPYLLANGANADFQMSVFALLAFTLIGWAGIWLVTWKWADFIVDAAGLMGFAVTIFIPGMILSTTLYNARQLVYTPDEVSVYSIVFTIFFIGSPFVFFALAMIAKESAENFIRQWFWRPHDEKAKL